MNRQEINDRDHRGILILTPFFSPNIGGVETHLDDWCRYLADRDIPAGVVTFQPLTINLRAPAYEERGSVHIRRTPWIGRNLFHRLEKLPFLQFLYLTPALLFSALKYMIRNQDHVSIIHAHGLNAAFVGWVLKKLFKIPCVLSTHAVYPYPPGSRTARISRWVMERLDGVICLSDASYHQMTAYGLSSEFLSRFRYWVDQELFKPGDKAEARRTLGIRDRFTLLFVGRLIPIKGADILLDLAKEHPDWNMLFVGTGPMEPDLQQAERELENVRFFGRQPNHELQPFFHASDVLVVPSQYEEGFGRVIIEALSCGCPVVGSDCGGIREALGEGRGILVQGGDRRAFGEILEGIREGRILLPSAAELRRKAEDFFSEQNGETILHDLYEKMSA